MRNGLKYGYTRGKTPNVVFYAVYKTPVEVIFRRVPISPHFRISKCALSSRRMNTRVQHLITCSLLSSRLGYVLVKPFWHAKTLMEQHENTDKQEAVDSKKLHQRVLTSADLSRKPSRKRIKPYLSSRTISKRCSSCGELCATIAHTHCALSTCTNIYTNLSYEKLYIGYMLLFTHLQNQIMVSQAYGVQLFHSLQIYKA